MRSVRATAAAGAATLPVALALAGCVSTQHIAARARLVNARIRAGQTATRVDRPNPAIRVAAPAVIRARGSAAIVVPMTNNSPRALTDLPISVGVRTRSGRTVYLNSSPDDDYFASHVASIGPGTATAWVLTIHRRLPAGRPFATVGFPVLSASTQRQLPRVDAASATGVTAGDRVVVSIVNRSAIPQYDLPLYVVARRGRRYVAAGSAAVAHLGTNGATRVSVALVGNSRSSTLRLIALPTILN